MKMTRTMTIGVQFLGTAAGCAAVAGLSYWPIHEQFHQCPFHGIRAFLYLLVWLSGCFAVATGLVAVIYLISGGVELLGRLKAGDGKLTEPEH